MSRAVHLVRRFLWSVRGRVPGGDDRELAETVLSAREMRLWSSMQAMDRSHSLMVLARRRRLDPPPDRHEEAAALLHDVGKTASRLGLFARVFATLLGPRTWRMRLYHVHDPLGLEMLRGTSDPEVIGILEGRNAEKFELLRRADDI